MKKFIFAFALLLGLVGLVKANEVWNVSVATGQSLSIGSDGVKVKVRRLVVSSGTTVSNGTDSVQLYRKEPSGANGAGPGIFPTNLFIATAAITPPVVFQTTVTGINNLWSAGDCETCFITSENGIYLRKSAVISGGANQAAVEWSY
jgi:hypothetical protein